MSNTNEPTKKSVETNSSDSSEEEESSPVANSSSDYSDSDEETFAAEKPLPPPVKSSQSAIQAPSSEYETNSDEDEVEETSIANKQLPPPAPSAYNVVADSEPKPTHTTPTTAESSKRPATGIQKSSKKQKTEHESDSKEKVLFQRVWSDDDVIVILQGMIDYVEEKKSPPNEDMDAFLESIKKKLSVKVNKHQLASKIRRLKEKFKSNKTKARVLTKQHDIVTYELSEKVWGEEIEIPGVKVNGVGKKTHIVASSFSLDGQERILRIGAEMFQGNEEIEGSKEWKELQIEDMKLSLRKLELKRACMKLVLDKM